MRIFGGLGFKVSGSGALGFRDVGLRVVGFISFKGLGLGYPTCGNFQP